MQRVKKFIEVCQVLVAHTYNHRIQEAEAVRFCELNTSLVYKENSQTARETLSSKQTNKQEKKHQTTPQTNKKTNNQTLPPKQTDK